MLHYEPRFGNVSERRESKGCAVLMKHRRKVKGEQMITLQMAQQLKTKNVNVVPRQPFCRQCKARFLLETDSLHWWSRTIFQKHTKYKLTAWKIKSLILMIKMLWKKKWMTWLGSTRECKKNWKQHHIQNKSKFLLWYLINGLECTVQKILMSLNTSFEFHMKSKK